MFSRLLWAGAWIAFLAGGPAFGQPRAVIPRVPAAERPAELPAASGLSLLVDRYAAIVSKDPKDEFSRVFGGFLAMRQASPENMRQLSDAAFGERLAWSKRLNTGFAHDVEPGWQDPAVVTPLWRQRLQGHGLRSWPSFGIKDHPRSHEIWELFESAFPKSAVRGELPGEGRGALWTLQARRGRLVPSEGFMVFRRERDGSYWMLHPDNAHVPGLLDGLDALWRRAQNRSLKALERAEALADFEWRWFWTNPYGRAAALTGDILSLLLQRQLEPAHRPILRTGYVHQDLLALAQPRRRYMRERLRDWGLAEEDPR